MTDDMLLMNAQTIISGAAAQYMQSSRDHTERTVVTALLDTQQEVLEARSGRYRPYRDKMNLPVDPYSIAKECLQLVGQYLTSKIDELQGTTQYPPGWRRKRVRMLSEAVEQMAAAESSMADMSRQEAPEVWRERMTVADG